MQPCILDNRGIKKPCQFAKANQYLPLTRSISTGFLAGFSEPFFSIEVSGPLVRFAQGGCQKKMVTYDGEKQKITTNKQRSKQQTGVLSPNKGNHDLSSLNQVVSSWHHSFAGTQACQQTARLTFI